MKNLRSGCKYRVFYKLKGVHRREHVFVAVFLCDNALTMMFDARPLAGTQTLDKRNFIRAELVPLDTPCSVDP